MVEELPKGHKTKILALFCLYRLVLDFIYIFWQEFFTGIARLGVEESFDRYVLSWIPFLVLIFFYTCLFFNRDKLKTSFSQQAMLLLILLSVIPFFSMYSAGVISDECCYYYNILFYVLLLVQVGINYFFYTNTTLSEIKNNNHYKICKIKKYFFVIMCSITIFSIIVTFFYFVGGKLYLDGINVYEQRAFFSTIQNNMPRVLVYVLGFANVIEIIMMIYCLHIKKYLYAVFLIIIWYMHFSLAAEKSVFLSVIMAVVIYLVAKKITMGRVIVFHIATALICLFLACFKYIYYVIDCDQSDFFDVVSSLGSPIPADIFRRLVFLPVYLQNLYVGYFADRTPNYWGINPEYSIGPGLENYISDVYFNSPLGHANTGLLGDCFVNMGVYGVLVYPIVLGIILCCFDYVLKGKNAIIFMGLALWFANYIMNSVLTTIMVSHGGFVMLLMLWCFPDDNDGEQKENEESIQRGQLDG